MRLGGALAGASAGLAIAVHAPGTTAAAVDDGGAVASRPAAFMPPPRRSRAGVSAVLVPADEAFASGGEAGS